MDSQNLSREQAVSQRKLRVVAFWAVVLSWIFLTLLFLILPQSIYQDFLATTSKLWWKIPLVIVIFLLLKFCFPVFVNNPSTRIIRLVDRRFTIEFIFLLFILLSLFWPIKQNYLYRLISLDYLNPAFLIFKDGAAILLLFLCAVAAQIRIYRLVEKEKTKVGGPLPPIYSPTSAKLSIFLLTFLLVLLIITAPLLGFFYNNEIKEQLGDKPFFSLVYYLQFFISIFLLIFILPPIASFLRSRRYTPKFLSLNFSLLVLLYFFIFSPFASYFYVVGYFESMSPWSFLLLSVLMITLHSLLLIDVVVRYQELLDAERFFKTQ